jgi:hypothetical protein
MQDTSAVNTKPTRRYPLASLVAILALITLVGVYIFSLSLKQNGMLFGLKQTNMIEKEREQPCHNSSVPESEIPYVHYPSPDTYSRYGDGLILGIYLGFTFFRLPSNLFFCLLGKNARAHQLDSLLSCRCRGREAGGSKLC